MGPQRLSVLRDGLDRARGRTIEKIVSTAGSLGVRAARNGRHRTAKMCHEFALTVEHRVEHQPSLYPVRANHERALVIRAQEDFNAGRYDRALRGLNRACAMHEENGPLADSDHAFTLYLIGMCYLRTSLAPYARHFFAKEVIERRRAGDDQTLRIALNNLAVATIYIAEVEADHGEYRDAAATYEHAAEIAGEAGEEEARAEAMMLRGGCLVGLGDHSPQALEFMQATVDLWREIEDRDPDEPDSIGHGLVRVHKSLAACLRARGETAEALGILEESLDRVDSLPPCQCRMQLLHAVSRCMEDLGDFLAVERYLRAAIEIAAERDRSSEIAYRADMAVHLARRHERYPAGLESERTLAMIDELLADARKHDARLASACALTRLGEAAAELGNSERALELIARAAAIFEQIPHHERLASCHLVSGTVLFNRHDPEAAKRHFERALELGISLGDLSIEANARIGCADCELVSPQHPEAAAHRERVLEIYEYLGDYRRVSDTLATLGRTPGVSLQRAAGYLTRAAVISERVGDPAAYASVLRMVARARTGIGLEAGSYYLKGLRTVESVRARLGTPAQRAALLEAHAELYADAAWLAHAQGDDVLAFRYADAGRARITLDRRDDQAEGLVTDPELRQLRRELAGEIGERTETLAGIGLSILYSEGADAEGGSEGDGLADRMRPEIEALESELAELEGRWQKLEARLRASDPRFAARAFPGLESIHSVEKLQQDLLGEDDALLEYLLAEDGSLLFCLTRETFAAFEIRLDQDSLGELINELCEAITTAAPNYPHGHRLYQELVAPAAGMLAGKQNLLICSDGVLHSLPFAVLLREEPKSNEAETDWDWDALPYLIGDGTSVRFIPSATSEALLAKANSRPPAYAGELLAVSAPLSSHGFAKAGLPPLPYAEHEVSAISEAFRSRGMQPLADLTAATKVRALEALEDGTGAPRFLHFATHAQSADRTPWLSSLVFEPDEGGQPGRLHANELIDLDLPAECLTMSGCNTFGDSVSAGEGVLGLALAFRYAGARNVCASRWSVFDRSTAALMEDFYSRLGSGDTTPAQALGEAQRAAIARSAHPRGWSAFSVFG